MSDSFEARTESLKRAVRKTSDATLEMARWMVRLWESGEWQEQSLSFNDYMIRKLGDVYAGVRGELLERPGELLRVQQKLDLVGISPAVASEIGWWPLQAAADRLQPDNVETVLDELKSPQWAKIFGVG